MTIQAGDQLPEIPVQRIRGGVESIDTTKGAELCWG